MDICKRHPLAATGQPAGLGTSVIVLCSGVITNTIWSWSWKSKNDDMDHHRGLIIFSFTYLESLPSYLSYLGCLGCAKRSHPGSHVGWVDNTANPVSTHNQPIRTNAKKNADRWQMSTKNPLSEHDLPKTPKDAQRRRHHRLLLLSMPIQPLIIFPSTQLCCHWCSLA